MPLRTLTGNLKRKNGMQWWVVYCPYCKQNHWMEAGPYTENPTGHLGARTLPCRSVVEIIADVGSLKRIKRQFRN
ncbi:MAG: hypothetical protein DRP56_04120 [Planctomycetota bacterium]|nr:MAG: hypothetical protein DRP56_04120 [Planctomycetota bacterium]